MDIVLYIGVLYIFLYYYLLFIEFCFSIRVFVFR